MCLHVAHALGNAQLTQGRFIICKLNDAQLNPKDLSDLIWSSPKDDDLSFHFTSQTS